MYIHHRFTITPSSRSQHYICGMCVHRETEAYYGAGNNNDDSDDETSRRRVAQETKSLIMQEFADRKRRIEEKKPNSDLESSKYSKCKAAESTGKKVTGLTVSGREGYLTLLTEALYNNFNDTKEAGGFDKPLSRYDIEQCAVQMEYEAFRSSTVISLYRRAMSKLISSVKACNTVFPQLKEIEPKKRNTLSEFVKEYEQQKQEKSQNTYGFITASQLENIKQVKNEARSICKAEKETKRKANSFKRDPLMQTKLQSFFNKASHESLNDTWDESDEDGELIIDENNEEIRFKENDTRSTLKITEFDKSDDECSTDDRFNNSKTFVINITLNGIPQNNKDSKVVNKTEEERNYKENEKVKSEVMIHDKVNPTAKRKIKALFGESSDSDESPEPKKVKTKECEKNIKHKKGTSEKKRRDKELDSENIKKTKSAVKQKSLFEDRNVSESEKELVFDDSNEQRENRTAEETLILNTDSVESNESANISLENKHKETFLPIEVEDSKLNKARQLSLVADEVLQKLKHFSEIQPAPTVIEKPIAVKVEKSLEVRAEKPIEVKAEKPIEAKAEKPIEAKAGKPIEAKAGKPIEAKAEKLESNLNNTLSSSSNKHDKKHTHITKDTSKHKSLSKKVRVEKIDKKIKSDKCNVEKSKDEFKKHKESSTKKSEKVDVAGLVVKLLMPYYKKKKISSRDLFKITARHIVHQLLAIQVTEEAAIDLLLKKTLGKEIIENENDLVVKLNLSNVI